MGGFVHLLTHRTGAGKPGAAKTWGWKPHLPTATASCTCHAGGALASDKQQAPSSCSGHRCSNVSWRRRQWKAASPRCSRGPRTRGVASKVFTPGISWTLSSLEVAGRERVSQRDATAGLRIPHSCVAAPRLSATAGTPASAPLSGGILGTGGLVLLPAFIDVKPLSLCQESIQASLMSTLRACSVGLSQRAVLPRACRQLVPGGRLLLEAVPPGSSSLWAHQAQGSQGPPPAGLWRGRVKRALQGGRAGPCEWRVSLGSKHSLSGFPKSHDL